MERQEQADDGTKHKEITELLHAWKDGDQEAFNTLIHLVHDRLKGIAHNKLRQHVHREGMQTTELLNEACISLLGKQNMDWKDRAHFYNTAAKAMYRFLIDQARKRKAVKHGGEWRETDIFMDLEERFQNPDVMLALDAALTELEKKDGLMVEVVKLRHFAGFTIEETADILEITVNQANGKYRFAKSLLHDMLDPKV